MQICRDVAFSAEYCPDVLIDYEPVAAESKINTIFTSTVSSCKESAAKGSSPSTSENVSIHSSVANADGWL